MLKKFHTLIAFLCITFASLVASAEPLTLNQILESTCRVRAGSSSGSGTIVATDNTTTYILTNAHVVGNQKSATVEFFGGGYQRKPIKGVVSYAVRKQNTDVDFAIINVPNVAFPQDHPPVAIPLAPENYRIKTGDYIVSAGCPAARWPVAWEGHVLQKLSSRILFTPPPIGGQSGSGIFVQVADEKGELYTRLGAVLTWRIGNGSEINPGTQLMGGAIPVTTLYSVLRGEVRTPEAIPDYYIEVADNGVCQNCQGIKEEHALGSDGNLYCVTLNELGNMQVAMPPGITVQTWPVRCPTCPKPNKPGQPPRVQPPKGKGGSPIIPPKPRDKIPIPDQQPQPPKGIPPIFPPPLGEEKEKPKVEQPKAPELIPIIPPQPDPLQKENDTLKDQNAELLKKIKEYELQIIDLEKTIKILDNAGQQIFNEAKALKAELEEAQRQLAAGNVLGPTEIKAKQAEIDRLNQLIAGKEKEAIELNIALNAKIEQFRKITGEITIIKEQNDKLSGDAKNVNNIKNQRNIFGGTTLAGLFGVLSTWLYGRYKRLKASGSPPSEKVVPVGPTPQGPVQQPQPDIAKALSDAVDKIEDRLKIALDNQKAATAEQILRLQKQNVEQRTNSEPTDVSRRPPGIVYQEPRYVTRGYPAPDIPQGLPPVPPNYPAYQYTVHDVLSAVDEVASRHSADPALRSVPVLVRQILESPSRPRKP